MKGKGQTNRCCESELECWLWTVQMGKWMSRKKKAAFCTETPETENCTRANEGDYLIYLTKCRIKDKCFTIFTDIKVCLVWCSISPHYRFHYLVLTFSS